MNYTLNHFLQISFHSLASIPANQVIDASHTFQGDFPYTQDPDQKLWQRIFFGPGLTQQFDMFAYYIWLGLVGESFSNDLSYLSFRFEQLPDFSV